MVLDKELADASPATNSRKRRRKVTEHIPDTAPARHTRSATRSQTSLASTVTPTITRTTPQPAPPLPSMHSQAPVRKTKKTQVVIKPASQVYRYLPRDMPEDLGGLPVC